MTVTAPRSLTIWVNDQALTVRDGQSVAAALLVSGISVLRRSRSGAPRGLFCGIGVCFDCVAEIDGRPGTRTCLEAVRDGMHIKVPEAGHDA